MPIHYKLSIIQPQKKPGPFRSQKSLHFSTYPCNYKKNPLHCRTVHLCNQNKETQFHTVDVCIYMYVAVQARLYYANPLTTQYQLDVCGFICLVNR